jgi:hypothetical protein
MKANLEAKATFLRTLQPSGEQVREEETSLFSFNQSDSFAKAYGEINDWFIRQSIGRIPLTVRVIRLDFQGELNTREREETED